MKAFLWVGAIVVIAVGVFYTLNKFSPQPNSTPTQQAADKVTAVRHSLTNSDFVWRIENARNWEETMPRHIVYLYVEGKTYKVGESVGCDTMNGPEEPNELTRKLCWFAGGGDVYSVFNEKGTYVVKHKWVQEGGGPDVDATPEGPWETVLKIN